MTAGFSATSANAFLNVKRNTAISAVAAVYVKLHTGDPGSAGTANASAVTTRNAITWGAPSGGSMALATLANYSMTTGETISYVSLWDASTAGTFLESWQLTSGVAVVNGSTLTFGTFTLAITPVAA